MKHEEFPEGTLLAADEWLVFFGNKHAQMPALVTQFPELSFSRVQQVHGDVVVKSMPGEDLAVKADAHFSRAANHALCVVTADCMPILIGCSRTKSLAGIHAGWRGIANRITVKTIAQLLDFGSTPDSLRIFVGPHIHQTSFEVDFDVRDQIIGSAPHARGDLYFDKGGKSYVDLFAVLNGQLAEFGLSDAQIVHFAKDTVTDLQYHSFRRDHKASGRQLSFIARRT